MLKAPSRCGRAPGLNVAVCNTYCLSSARGLNNVRVEPTAARYLFRAVIAIKNKFWDFAELRAPADRSPPLHLQTF
jgi:hypothetical protein